LIWIDVRRPNIANVAGAQCPGRARQQIEKPMLVGRIYREDIYQDDHAVRSSLLLPEALPVMKG